MYAVRVHEYGGPEVLSYEEVPTPEPGEDQALVKVQAIGVNYIEIYQRTGQYTGTLPFTPGSEMAGVVEAVGPGVTDLKAGDRVVSVAAPGSYAQYVVAPADKLVPIPEGIDYKTAAAALLQGITAHYLSYSTYPVQPGETVLVHAAAGGLGLLLTQVIKMRGGHVIGTVSTEEKAQLAREAGADEVILYTQVDFDTEVKRLTNGKGVAAVYDSVGKTTFDKSLNCLKMRGYMVLCGASSGQVPPFNPQVLNAKGSLYLTRPTLGHYTADRAALLERAGAVLNWVAKGELKVRVGNTYALKDVAQAHRDLAGRGTTGKLLLLPD